MAYKIEKFGWIPDRPDQRDIKFAGVSAQDVLPPMIDLEKKCPPIQDQSTLGSCTANAIGAMYHYIQDAEGFTDFTPSRLFIYYNERAMENTINSDSGAQIRDGLHSIVTAGVCDEKDWPYDINQFAVQPSKNCYDKALKHEGLQYQSLSQNLNTFKTCLANGHVFVGGISVYNSFPMNTDTGIIPMPQPNEEYEGGHAICFVGYDDKTRLFKFRNSWGTSWGLRGYGFVPYEYLVNPDLATDFWTLLSVEK